MVIDNEQQLDEIAKYSDVLIVPIPEDDRHHPTQTNVIALAIRDLDNDKSYIVSISHPEATYHMSKIDIGKFKNRVYCTNIPLMWKYFDNNTLADVLLVDYEMMAYLGDPRESTKIEVENSKMVNRYNQNMPGCKKINTLISLLKLQEYVDDAFNQYPSLAWPNEECLKFYSNKVRGLFNWIETNGLQVDVEKYKKQFGKTFSRVDDKCYTQYNYYTTTGRPSNRFGGINYAALPKDQTRECFISRYGEDGCLVELDFNSYHPRIIAVLIDYDFGKDNVYEHLAKHYHKTDTPTKDQIKQAKEDTFRQLYGGIRKEYLQIPFFEKTHKYIKRLWSDYMNVGYIVSPISQRRVYPKDSSPYLLFNHFIQLIETELNVEMLGTLGEHFMQSGIKCEPVLYTYDSVLFDVHKDHKNLLIKDIIPASINLEKFPVKLKSGNNYANLKFC